MANRTLQLVREKKRDGPILKLIREEENEKEEEKVKKGVGQEEKQEGEVPVQGKMMGQWSLIASISDGR